MRILYAHGVVCNFLINACVQNTWTRLHVCMTANACGWRNFNIYRLIIQGEITLNKKNYNKFTRKCFCMCAYASHSVYTNKVVINQLPVFTDWINTNRLLHKAKAFNSTRMDVSSSELDKFCKHARECS